MDPINGLSNREKDVVKLLMEGKSNKLIASALHITENTVEFHLKNIYSKLQVNSRTELIIKLGNSVVADKKEIDETKERPGLWNWFTSMKETVSGISKELKMENVINGATNNEDVPMTFFESILVCFKKYAEFNGRASRLEFWWFALFITLVTSALVYISETLGSVFLIATLLPLLAVGTRRLRDTGKSGWWQLFLLVPVGGLVILGFLWAEPTLNPQSEDSLPM
ncbi:MAG: LuxR C-terminal-related transcriptional regulator [Anaerolineaceae bacterium]